MHRINHESISDFGLRKLLGIRTHASRYIDGLSPLRKDTYMMQRKRIHMQFASDKSQTVKNTAKLLSVAAVVAGITAFFKNKSGVPKVGLGTKIRNLFSH